jgi:hypothetical protein
MVLRALLLLALPGTLQAMSVWPKPTSQVRACSSKMINECKPRQRLTELTFFAAQADSGTLHTLDPATFDLKPTGCPDLPGSFKRPPHFPW